MLELWRRRLWSVRALGGLHLPGELAGGCSHMLGEGEHHLPGSNG